MNTDWRGMPSPISDMLWNVTGGASESIINDHSGELNAETTLRDAGRGDDRVTAADFLAYVRLARNQLLLPRLAHPRLHKHR